jgi:2-polyprenyl-3-methyl-5-hydroxy-6-metoxy-1,4-benzoquinol methylase
VDSNSRLLVAIASYGTGNDRFLARLIEEYQSMSLKVRIVVLSNIDKPLPPGVDLIVGLPTKDPWSLPFAHKKVLSDGLEEHDLFIYTEDDTLITERHIEAFLRVSQALPENEIPGFFRYEEYGEGLRNYAELHGHFHWDPSSVRVRGEYVFAYMTNEHAACYLLTQKQLRAALVSGGFLVPPHHGKYDMACTAATDPYTQCGFRKVLCVSHFDEFLIQHLPNKYVGTRFGIDKAQISSQIEALLRIAAAGERPTSLFETETKLADARHSKDYYEPVHRDLASQIPEKSRSILSVGCGAGTLEVSLLRSGKVVTAVPIDPVISAGAESKGVEMIQGDFRVAREMLGGRRFDCLIFSNVLHLVPAPTAILSSFGELLREDGALLALAPNLSRLPDWWRKVSGDPRYQEEVAFDKSGVHATSHAVLKDWLAAAGLRCEKILNVLPNSAQNVRRMTLGVADRFVANEIIAVGKRA